MTVYLQVLVVVDDVEVRRCVQAVSAVEVKVRNIGSVSSSSEMVSGFKVSCVCCELDFNSNVKDVRPVRHVFDGP